MAHQRGAGILSALLLSRSAGEGGGLGASGDALVLTALSAALEGQERDASEDADAEDDGDDDATDFEVVLELHANVLAVSVQGALETGSAGGSGDLGGEA